MGQFNQPTALPDEMTIYDVLRELVEMARWTDEASKLRRLRAIQVAQDNKLFGSEGSYKL